MSKFVIIFLFAMVAAIFAIPPQNPGNLAFNRERVARAAEASAEAKWDYSGYNRGSYGGYDGYGTGYNTGYGQSGYGGYYGGYKGYGK